MALQAGQALHQAEEEGGPHPRQLYCSSHHQQYPEVHQAHLLPPNTTSVTQPKDKGIITSFKSHYHNYFVQHGLLKAMEAGRDRTVLDAIYGVEAAWNKVTPATIKNCFNYCGFVVTASASTPEDDDTDDGIPLAELIQSLRQAGMDISAEDEALYKTVNDNLLTSAPMTVQDIAKEVLNTKAAKDPEDNIPDEEDVEEEGPAPPPQHSRRLL